MYKISCGILRVTYKIFSIQFTNNVEILKAMMKPLEIQAAIYND